MPPRARNLPLAALAYAVVTFPLAYVWHLVALPDLYFRLGAFGRQEPIIALGLITILVQGALFAVFYPRFRDGERWVRDGLRFGFFAGVFLWSTQVVAAAAKHPIEPISTWIAIETLYVAVQFTLVGLVFGWIHRRAT
jgi:hypothetical protein